MSEMAATLDKDKVQFVQRSQLSVIWRGLRRSKPGMIGLVLLVVHLFVALASPWIIPYSATEMDGSKVWGLPNSEHLLGNDAYGRDILTRLLLGGRIAILVSFMAAAVSITWGGTLGVLLGLVGGRVDDIAMRVIDALLSVPGLLITMLGVMTFGSSPVVLIATMAWGSGLSVSRVSRGATQAFAARDFIAVARARGDRNLTIAFRELLPNVRDVLLVELAMRWSWMLLAVGGLSFLGLGISPPTPDWGLMVTENRGLMAVRPWATLAPVIALSSLTIGINLFGDALSKAIGLGRTQEAT